jgi:hypothetical protein
MQKAVTTAHFGLIRRRKGTNWLSILLILGLAALPVWDWWFGTAIKPVGLVRGVAQVLGGPFAGLDRDLGRGPLCSLVGADAGLVVGNLQFQPVDCLKDQGCRWKALATTGLTLPGAGAMVPAPDPRGIA